MDEWEEILSRLDDYHAEQSGSPAQLLQLIAELLDESGEMYADTMAERQALNAVALRLRNMVCDDDQKLDRSLQQLTDLLSAWDYADSKGIKFPSASIDELNALREERNCLERTLRERDQQILELEENITHLQQMYTALREHAPIHASNPTAQSGGTQSPTGYGSVFPDPFRDITSYDVRWLDLSRSGMVPVDAPHLGITNINNGVLDPFTFYYLPMLKTLQFQCPVHRIDANAFYLEAKLALKFQNAACDIHPQAFSAGAQITAICAPRGTGPSSLEHYARTHNIPFIPL